jgi:transposase
MGYGTINGKDQEFAAKSNWDGWRDARDNHLFVEAVISWYRAGIPWRDLPDRFGDWNNIARRHRRWAERSVWHSIFAPLAEHIDNEYAMIDSTRSSLL